MSNATSSTEPLTEPTDGEPIMAAAPMRYRDDGSVDWGNMWDDF